VNFNVNFNVLLSKYIVHPLVKIKKTLIISRCTVHPPGGGGSKWMLHSVFYFDDVHVTYYCHDNWYLVYKSAKGVTKFRLHFDIPGKF
jgi:hypothetical protein